MDWAKTQQRDGTLDQTIRSLRRRLRSSEERRESIEVRFERMRSVSRVCTEMLRDSHSGADVLERLRESCRDLLGLTSCTVMLWKQVDGQTILAPLKKGASLPQLPEEGIVAAMRLSSEPRFLCHEGQEQLWVPLKVEEPLGVVCLEREASKRGFSTDDVSAAMTLVTQAASVVERHSFFELATTDGLTGVSTRRHFTKLFGDELLRMRRYGRPVSLVLFDIDHFKTINDTLGHQAGDEVLRNVAKHARESLREVDIVGRFGGDEFVLALPETDEKGAQEVARRVTAAVSTACGVTLSAGVVTAADGDSVDALIARADEALYSVKVRGRDGVCVYREFVEAKRPVT